MYRRYMLIMQFKTLNALLPRSCNCSHKISVKYYEQKKSYYSFGWVENSEHSADRRKDRQNDSYTRGCVCDLLQVNNVCCLSRGRPEGFLFNSYYIYI